MATVHLKSQAITDMEATPLVKQDVHDLYGRVRALGQTVALSATDDSAGSTYRFFRVHSSWQILSIQFYTTGIDASVYDCGLYHTNNGPSAGAEADLDLYADGVSGSTSAPAVPPTADAGGAIEMRFADANTANLGDFNNRVYEDLGLSADPGLEYDMALTTSTAGTVAGTLGLRAYVTAGD